MSLNVKLDDTQRQIRENTARFNSEKRRIQSDPKLSQEGRTFELEKAYLKARAAHNRLIQQRNDAIAGERQRLRTAALSNRSSAHLPAAERATIEATFRQTLMQVATTADDAKGLTKMLALAESSNDNTLRRAVGVVAAERGSTEVLSKVAQTEPGFRELLDFERTHGAGRSLEQKFADSVALTPPSAPAGISQAARNRAVDATTAAD